MMGFHLSTSGRGTLPHRSSHPQGWLACAWTAAGSLGSPNIAEDAASSAVYSVEQSPIKVCANAQWGNFVSTELSLFLPWP